MGRCLDMGLRSRLERSNPVSQTAGRPLGYAPAGVCEVLYLRAGGGDAGGAAIIARRANTAQGIPTSTMWTTTLSVTQRTSFDPAPARESGTTT
jgi:hypothetical protein